MAKQIWKKRINETSVPLDAVGVSLQDQEISLFGKFTFFRRLKSKFEFYTREYITSLVCVREFA